MNGDGHPDLAVANGTDNTISVLLGNGDGTFGAAATWAVGTSPQALACADFNGDGYVDLAVADNGSSDVTVLDGDGTGNFFQQAAYGLPQKFCNTTPEVQTL
jgi:hypothetical protein